MTSYFYHLKFELYSIPNLAVENETPVISEPPEIWLPPATTHIFDDFPSHSRPEPSQRTEYYSSSKASTTTLKSSLVDCSNPQLPAQTLDWVHNPQVASERQWLDRLKGYPKPSLCAAIRQQQSVFKDWRFGQVSIETLDPSAFETTMNNETGKEVGASAAPPLGPSFGGAGTATKAKCVSLKSKHTEVGWGVVHFYREGEETPGLYALETETEAEADAHGEAADEARADDYTTLCIPAVPAYMTPGDFLGFLGERWRNDISHCRMVMTSKMNRYLVLLKFRNNKKAKRWRQEFDGKVFNSMEPQVCHIVFVRSITFETPTHSSNQVQPHASSSTAVSSSFKPFPPPTPNLVELPTCPVCLERMDETNGIMTIPCSHVFHCSCLQNWKGAGCPVCRFTNPSEADNPNNPYNKPFGSSASNLCSICDCTDDLWICLICGYVGCGRYKGGHAKDHWKDRAHCFALELETQYVWDYAGDMWVHRLIRDKGDGKVVELPGRSNQNFQHQEEDVVPRAKLESIGLEYTHLITSQLESQRAYYEEMLNKAVDKACKASAVSESAAGQLNMAMSKAEDLDKKYAELNQKIIPQLERDLDRERNKAKKGENLARSLGQSLQEEKRLNEGLMKRIEHVGIDSETMRKQLEQLIMENTELKEMNRDLSMFISGQEKLKEMEKEGHVEEGELEGGTVSVPEKKGKRKTKKK